MLAPVFSRDRAMPPQSASIRAPVQGRSAQTPHIPGEHPIRLQRCAQVVHITPIQILGVGRMAFHSPGARVDCMDLP